MYEYQGAEILHYLSKFTMYRTVSEQNDGLLVFLQNTDFRLVCSSVPPSGVTPEAQEQSTSIHLLFLFLEICGGVTCRWWRNKQWTGQQSLSGLIQADRHSFTLMLRAAGRIDVAAPDPSVCGQWEETSIMRTCPQRKGPQQGIKPVELNVKKGLTVTVHVLFNLIRCYSMFWV